MHGRRDTEIISLVTLSLVTKNLSRCHNNGHRGHLQGSDNYLYRIKLCRVLFATWANAGVMRCHDTRDQSESSPGSGFVRRKWPHFASSSSFITFAVWVTNDDCIATSLLQFAYIMGAANGNLAHWHRYNGSSRHWHGYYNPGVSCDARMGKWKINISCSSPPLADSHEAQCPL